MRYWHHARYFNVHIDCLAGLVAPIIANHFYLNGLSPHGIDLGPVSMSISFIFHGVALLTFQMFHVAPIARDCVFESMSEGVIVLNSQGLIVDYNQAMRNVIPDIDNGVIGKPIEKVLHGNPSLLEIIKQGKKGDYEMYLNGETSHFSIQFSSVRHSNNILIGQIITFVDMTERVLLQEKLKHLASTDGLTQLYNRTYFLSEAEKVLQTLHQEGGNVAVIMFDIDYFKVVNDTFGHVAGDHILSHVASVAKACLRESDLIGRYGGEEFIICLPNTTVKEAHELANLIRLKVSKSTGIVSNKKISVTSSFGVSSCFIKAGDNSNAMNTLMKQADQALYIAKNNGRNCVQVYKEAI